MSKLVCSTALAVTVLFLLGCAPQNSSAPGDKGDESSQTENPGGHDDSGEHNDNAPTLPANPDNSEKLCFATGNSCYELFNLEDVNRAENMYQYIGPGDSGFPSGFSPVHYRKPIKLFYIPEVPGTTAISDNFQRREVIWANSTRGHYGHFSPLVVQKLQALRERFGRPLVINSGYRSPGYNSTLNGAARFSRHTYGDAVDFKISGVEFGDIAKACRDLGAAFTQIYTSHIHCDWRTSPLEEKVFGPAPTSFLSSFSAHDVHQAMHKHSHVLMQQLDTLASSKTRIQLQIDTVAEDGGGDLAYEWQIKRNGESVHSSTLAAPIVELVQGSYEVF
ncbi:MAG: D-Ala-D-Ala carboxypeptidase family metallohydrolase, partial [Pseudomonadota bacterium]